MLRPLRHNPFLRWLFQVDRPVDPLTETELSAERERNYRWNFAANMMDVTAFWFGLSFISAATIVPLFISKLTDSPIPIGVAALIAQGAWFLPQIFTANAVERLPRMKAVVVNLGLVLERVPMWVIVLSAIIAARSPTLALIVFLIGYAWRGFGGGLVATAWQDLIARCFPVERRGRFMGISFFIGALTGALGAAISAQFLGSFPYPANFAYVFAVAAIAISISWVFLLFVREPVEPVRAPRRSSREYWAELPGILRRDDNYRHFLAGRLLLALSGMGLGFVTVAAIRKWDVADSTVGAYTAAILAGQMLANLSLGFLADRRGHVASLELGALASLLAFSLAWLAPAAELFFLVFVLLGFAEGALIVSGIPVAMEFSSAEKRPTYMGLTNSSVGVVSMVGPLIGAWLALIGYNLLFAASAFVSLLALIVFHWRVHEPRWARSREQETRGGEQGVSP
jgi:MFS family permease